MSVRFDPDFDPLTAAPIEMAMQADRHWLRRTARAWQDMQRAGKPAEELRERWKLRWIASTDRLEARIRNLPKISYPEELPITPRREEILQALKHNKVIIVSGETGSGKSTQLPKLCLEAGLGRAGMIGHTQPRRIAARSIAARLAEELQTQVGNQIGFKVRFTDQTAPSTLIKLMTDGMLLAETQRDRFLENYDCIIIDEAHERSLNIDFLMGYLHRLLQKRDDLHVVITSATIDAQRFSEHFTIHQQPAPVIEVSGRGYPVEIRYRPWQDDETSEKEYDLARHVLHAFDEVSSEGPGDVLIFLPTERHIREITHRLQGHLKRRGQSNQVELLPLYARLSIAEQNRVFQESSKRRVVLATNVAESSLTVPGIYYVIDSGTARISRYSPRSKVQRLPIEPISRASADQRAGRCGRVAPGICIRLFSAEDYLARDAYTTPEMRRTNLAAVLLQSLVLNLGSLDKFPLLDPPRDDQIREGFKTLRELQAIDDHRRLTEIGKLLGQMPIDPRVGRMILEARERNCLPEVVVIAAALEAQDPRDRPADKQKQADQAHQPFLDPHSDFVTYLKLWYFYQHLRRNLSKTQFRKACQTNFLSPVRLREWNDLARQLLVVARGLDKKNKRQSQRARGQKGIDETNDDTKADAGLQFELPADGKINEARYTALHQSLLTGLLSGIALAGEKHIYQGSGNLELYLWPGSGVFQTKPKWIVAAEWVETSRRFARTIARIDPAWLEPLASHLIRRSYSEPHWSRKRQAAMCAERVSLFGLPIVPRRAVPLAPIDPQTARELFIEHGLVEGELESRARCYQHNQKLRDALQELATKTRSRELVIDPYAVRRFYQERLPAECTGRVELEQFDRTMLPPPWTRQLAQTQDVAAWLKQPAVEVAAIQPDTVITAAHLYMQPQDILPQPAADIEPESFPDALPIPGAELPLEYRFAPGTAEDGITVTVPAAALAQVSDDRLDWFVPGLLEEKLVSLIKALPKRIRRNLVPAADVAKKVLEKIQPDQGQAPFMRTVCREFSKLAEMDVQPTDFETDKLPEHMQFLVKIVDDQGKLVASGRSVDKLKQDLGVQAKELAAAVAAEPDPEGLARDGLTTFDMESIPDQVQRVRGGVRVTLYPALVDNGQNVSVRLMNSPQAAEHATRGGLMRLYVIAEKKELRSQVQWLPGREQAQVYLAAAFPGQSLQELLTDLLARIAFVDKEPIVRTRDDFENRRLQRGRRIATAAQDVAKWLPDLANYFHAARLKLETLNAPKYASVKQDITTQLAELLSAKMWSDAQWEWLKHLPRYIKAIDYRLDKLKSGGEARDAQNREVIEPLSRDIKQLIEEKGEGSELRWQLEELRVSLFAQPLGTAIKVSPVRLRAAIEERRGGGFEI